MLSRILENISDSSPHIYLIGSVIICVIVCITIIAVTYIVQRGRTARTKILTDNVSPEKRGDIIGKQLEEELGDKSENNITEKVLESMKK